MPRATGYFRHPALHGDSIVFTCEDDLWSVAVAGGIPRRLTVGRGAASFPVFSPDGGQVAYAGREDGPEEVFVVDAEGGTPRRLSFTGGPSRPVAWRPDGSAVVFQACHRRPFEKDFHLHEVAPDGGAARLLPLGPAREIAWEPDGPGVALGINSGDPARWKRYRGGTAGTLWIDRQGKGKFSRLLSLDGNLAAPAWIGGRIYFLSDHEGHGNIYSCTPAGGGVRRHTHHEDFYVRYPSHHGDRIAYHAGADLLVLDVSSGESRRVEIDWRGPRTERVRRYACASEHLETAQLHPHGHSVAVTARGGAFTSELWEGAPTRHGETSKVRHRLAAWLADGQRIVAVTDQGGEESLTVMRADGTGRPKRIRADMGRAVELAVAPAGRDRVAVANHRNELWVVDAASGRPRLVERSEWNRISGLAWSPDGRWLAYSHANSSRSASLHVFDADSGRIHEVTRPEFYDHSPAFDPEGRYLYFISLRVFDPVYDAQYFDLGFPRGTRPFLIPLRASDADPFRLAQRAPRRPKSEPRPPERPTTDAPQSVEIDLEGIADRVVAFPVDEGRYQRVLGASGRVFFSSLPVEGSLGRTWHESGEPEAKARLEVHDFEHDKTETLVDEISDFSLSADARTLLLRVGNGLRVLPAEIEAKDLPEGDEPCRESGWLDVDRLRLAVEPGQEWRQMLLEAWRLQRDQFWTPDMSKVDWEAVRDRYLPLVDRVATRAEFSDLVWEMQGELATSHCYELGGDYALPPDWHQGHLGADFELDAAGRWIVADITRGDSWEPKASSPLAAPGLGIEEGDALLAVDGQPLSAELSPDHALVNAAGRRVVLTVDPRRGEPRRVTVTALASEHALRYRAWVEANRRRVHEQTRGRVGYLHVPDMGPWGYSEFHRAFRTEVLKPGLIVDVRWNRGGHVSQLLLEKLARRPLGWDDSRWMGRETYPSDAPRGPMVALTNEYAGSDGDIFSHAWKLLGLGPLVGKRTWGGVVGIWPRHALVDGTITTQAEFSSWFPDVGWSVENYGTDPDIEVDVLPQDHAAGRDPQLDRGLAEIKKLLREKPPKTPKLDKRPSLRPPRLGKTRAKRRKKRS